MVYQHRIQLKQRIIHASVVRIHANSILIRKLNAGIVDVWVNALYLVNQVVQHHVLVDVSIMMQRKVYHIKLVKGKDVAAVVH